MNGVDSVTNLGVIRTPYEVTFSSFSGELAGVVEGFMRSSNCFLLKNIQVVPSDRMRSNHFVDAFNTQPGLAPASVDAAPPPPAANQAVPTIESGGPRNGMEDKGCFSGAGTA